MVVVSESDDAVPSSQTLFAAHSSPEKKKSQQSWELLKKNFESQSGGILSTELLHPFLLVMSGCHMLLVHDFNGADVVVLVVFSESVVPSSQTLLTSQFSPEEKKKSQQSSGLLKKNFESQSGGIWSTELLHPFLLVISGCHALLVHDIDGGPSSQI